MKDFKWDKKYLHWGITAFCVIACSIVFYMLLHYVRALKVGLDTLTGILSPFIWGLVIAYLLTPVLNFYERRLFTPLCRRMGVKKKGASGSPKGARGLSVLLSEITLIIIIGALIYLILPQLYNSIETIVINTPTYVEKGVAWAEKVLRDYPQIEEYAVTAFGNVADALSNWIKTSVLPGLDNVVQNVTTGVYYFLRGVYNVVIGIIVSVYILHNKEIFCAHCKKILYSIFTVEAAAKIKDGIDFTDKTFMGFITGKLVDSAIIGMLCYIFCTIANMPYALLVSVIIGVTNIIPFFGPFIGAIPSALLILLIDPGKCLIFIIFIILLQQFDGNILGPKILGSTTGINGFWVMFAIILGAGLFGFMGMLLGVPVWVVIYTGIGNLIDRKLRRSGLPYDTDVYESMDRIDPVTRQVITKAQKTEKKEEQAGNAAPPKSDNKSQ